mmetsp:Transcript_11858/g.20054  ORF Transcript_11858/g.20054 Transcript_11858/m.20054 type:complete len:121 (+) Transcript_11858:33-395(+)
MACFSNDTKHKCSSFVTFVSVLTLLVGLFLLGIGIIQFNFNDQFNAEFADFNVNKIVAFICLFIGLLCLIASILGFLTAKYKNFLFTIPFMVLAPVVAILFLAGAAILGGDKENVQSVVD